MDMDVRTKNKGQRGAPDISVLKIAVGNSHRRKHPELTHKMNNNIDQAMKLDGAIKLIQGLPTGFIDEKGEPLRVLIIIADIVYEERVLLLLHPPAQPPPEGSSPSPPGAGGSSGGSDMSYQDPHPVLMDLARSDLTRALRWIIEFGDQYSLTKSPATKALIRRALLIENDRPTT